MARPFSQDWDLKYQSHSAGNHQPHHHHHTPQHHHEQQHQPARPVSEGTGEGPKYSSSEAEAIDSWFDDLNNYERTLETMGNMSFVDHFKEEMQAVLAWFMSQNESERTTIIYALLKQCSNLQIRFFLMVLQQMARNDPIASLLSPRGSLHEMGWCLLPAPLTTTTTSPSLSPSPSHSCSEKNYPDMLGKVNLNEQNASKRLLEVLPLLRDDDIPSDSSDSSRLYNRHSFPKFRRHYEPEHSLSAASAYSPHLEQVRHSAPPTTHYVLSNHTIPTEPLRPTRQAPPVPGTAVKRSSFNGVSSSPSVPPPAATSSPSSSSSLGSVSSAANGTNPSPALQVNAGQSTLGVSASASQAQTSSASSSAASASSTPNSSNLPRLPANPRPAHPPTLSSSQAMKPGQPVQGQSQQSQGSSQVASSGSSDSLSSKVLGAFKRVSLTKSDETGGGSSGQQALPSPTLTSPQPPSVAPAASTSSAALAQTAAPKIGLGKPLPTPPQQSSQTPTDPSAREEAHSHVIFPRHVATGPGVPHHITLPPKPRNSGFLTPTGVTTPPAIPSPSPAAPPQVVKPVAASSSPPNTQSQVLAGEEMGKPCFPKKTIYIYIWIKT